MPLVRIALVELLADQPGDIHDLYYLRRRDWHAHFLKVAAIVSRVSHRVRSQRWPSLVDFAGLKQAAGELRARHEAIG